MTTPVEATIKDASTSTMVPVEGIPVTESISNPTSGQVLRQTVAIADGAGGSAAGNYVGVQNNGVQIVPWNVAGTTGTIAANNAGVSVNIPSGCTGISYAITGTWVATLALQASYDNSNWVSIADIASNTSYTANKTGLVLAAPFQYFRVESTAYTSGTASISLQPVSNIGGVTIASGGYIAQVPYPNTDANNPAFGLSTVAQSLLYNGSTWDRARSDGTGKAQVSLYGKNSTAGDTAISVTSGGAVKIDGSAVTQPVSGTFWQSTQPVSIATAPALVASTAHIGNVGGSTAKIAVTPTVTASSAYTTGNLVGGLMTFSSALLTAGSGVLESISIRCKSVQTATFTFFLFDSNPTNSTWTNKSAPAINASDIPFLVGAYQLASYSSGLGTHTIYTLNGISQAISAGATTLYGVLTVTGTPTFASTSDITVVLGILQD